MLKSDRFVYDNLRSKTKLKKIQLTLRLTRPYFLKIIEPKALINYILSLFIINYNDNQIRNLIFRDNYLLFTRIC
jgi:hypothetical protein